MKRKVIYLFSLVIPLILCTALGKAQGYYNLNFLNAPGNPGGLNTEVDFPTPGTWTKIITGPSNTLAYSSIQTIPFTFQFNGNVVKKYKASSSGYVTFDTTVVTPATSDNVALPSSLLPDNTICAWGLEAKINDATDKLYSTVQTKVFGTAPNRQLWIQFYGMSSPEDPLAIGFWSVVLEETSNKIYVVDQLALAYTSDPNPLYPTLSVGVQINSTTAVQASASPLITNAGAAYGSVADNNYYVFIPGSQPAYDLGLVNLSFSKWYAKNSNINIAGNLYNYGSTSITSATINYSVDGGPAVSQPLTGLTLASGGASAFTHPTPYVPASAGNKKVKVWISQPNGNADTQNTNDTLTSTVVVVDSLIEKKALVEEFTQASCDPCANAAPKLNAALKTASSYINTVRYHVNFPGRDFMNEQTQPQVAVKLSYYKVTGVPDGKIDGVDFYPGNPSATTVKQLQAASGIKSPLLITGSYAYNKTHTINADIKSYMDLPAGLKVYAVIINNIHYTKNQSTETIAQFDFPETMTEILPTEKGGSLTAFTAGQTQHVSYTWTADHPLATQNSAFPYDSSNFAVVVFVQDNATQFVYQSAKFNANGVVADLSKVEGRTGNLGNAYPNPAIGQTTIPVNSVMPNSEIRIIDITGKLVLVKGINTGATEVSVNLSNLETGLYFYELVTNNHVIESKKLNVIK